MQFLWRLFWVTLPALSAALVNVTIDSKNGDPSTGTQFSYSPNGAWFDGPGCMTCTAHPNAYLAYDGTWIEGRFNSQPGTGAFPNVVLNASVSFTGELSGSPRRIKQIVFQAPLFMYFAYWTIWPMVLRN
jgi:hypothetical protein